MNNYVVVPTFEKYFAVSSNGDVFSLRTNKLLKTNVTASGYSSFATRLNGRKSKPILVFVHRLVALAFISNPSCEAKTQVNHKDGNKLNNTVDNLEWVTPSENMRHAFDNGLCRNKRGEDHPSATVSEDTVREIRAMHIPKVFGKRRIARIMGLPVTTVSSILEKNGSWKHLK